MFDRARRLPGPVPVFAVVVAASAVVLSQSQTQPHPTFRAGIDLVQIDVVVVDELGAPVRGLTAADFTLLDRGKPQQVAAFSEVSHESVEGEAGDAPLLPAALVRDVASNASARSDRVVVLVIDDLHLFRDRADTAKRLANRLVHEAGSGTAMAVLFTSGEHSTQVSQESGRHLEAIDTVEGRKAIRRPHEACDSPAGRRCSLKDFFDNMHLFGTLQDAARMLAADDGRRKAFVLISEGLGLNLQGIFGSRTTTVGPVDDHAAGAELAVVASDEPTRPGFSYHLNAAVQMMEWMRRSNVATYVIDPRGRVAQQDLLRECHPSPGGFGTSSDRCSDPFKWSSQVRWAQEGLALIADASGGFAVTNTDELDAGLDRILADLDHYYLLGFHPADPEGKGFRPVDVRVDRPGASVRYRRGYTGGPPPSPKNDSPLEDLVAGVMAVPDLRMKLSAVPLPDAAREKAARVAVSVEIAVPRERLAEPDGRLRDVLDFAVFAANEKNGKTTAGAAERLHLSLASPAGEARPDELRYQVDTGLILRPGRYQLRASGISRKLGVGGSVYLTLDVPDYGREALAVSPIALGYFSGARVPVLRSTGSAGPQSVTTPPFSPTLDREFSSTDTLRVFAHVARPAGLADAGVAPRVEVFDVGRDRLAGGFTPSVDDHGRIDVTMRLADLTPGGYVLRLVVDDAEHTVTRETGFVVR